MPIDSTNLELATPQRLGDTVGVVPLPEHPPLSATDDAKSIGLEAVSLTASRLGQMILRRLGWMG